MGPLVGIDLTTHCTKIIKISLPLTTKTTIVIIIMMMMMMMMISRERDVAQR